MKVKFFYLIILLLDYFVFFIYKIFEIGNDIIQLFILYFLCLIFITLEDNILKLQNELNEVTDIMKKNLTELLARDENLDVLMSKSKDLSTVSLEFYQKAKKANNKCCNLY